MSLMIFEHRAAFQYKSNSRFQEVISAFCALMKTLEVSTGRCFIVL